MESDRNEVRHTDPHCTLLLLLPVFFIFLLLLLLLPPSLPLFFFIQPMGFGVGVARPRDRDGDRRRLARARPPRAYKGARLPLLCLQYFYYGARGKQTGETMRKRSRSSQPHGSSSPQTSGAAHSHVHVGDLHHRCPERHVSNLAGRVFSRTGS